MKITISGKSILALLFIAVSLGIVTDDIVLGNYKYEFFPQALLVVGVILFAISVVENEIRLRKKV